MEGGGRGGRYLESDRKKENSTASGKWRGKPISQHTIACISQDPILRARHVRC